MTKESSLFELFLLSSDLGVRAGYITFVICMFCSSICISIVHRVTLDKLVHSFITMWKIVVAQHFFDKTMITIERTSFKGRPYFWAMSINHRNIDILPSPYDYAIFDGKIMHQLS